MEKEEEAPYVQQKIRHAPYSKELFVYTIDGHELDTLSKGLVLPLYFNFSIFFLSFSGSLIGSMLPTILAKIPCSNWISLLFIIGCTIFVCGIFLLVFWFIRGEEIKKVVQDIKKRMPPAQGTPVG